MDEANRKDCSRCRERRSTSKINGAKGLDLYRITLGLLLLLLLLLLTMTLAMLGLTQMRAKDGTALKRTLSNAVGDLGISRQEANTLDKSGEIRDDIDAIHSSGTAVHSSEQLRHRRNRRTRNENADTSRRNDSDTDGFRSIHSESQPTTDTDPLADFKQLIHHATSFDEIRVIIQSSTVLKDVFPSPSQTTTTGASDLRRRLLQCRRRSRSSVGAKSSVGKSNGSTQPGLQELLKVLQTNITCNRIPATIVSEFGLGRDRNKSIQLPVCGPKETLLSAPQSEASSAEKNKAHLDPESMNILEKAAATHDHWMDEIIENSLCRPVKMILDLAPPEGVAMGNEDNDNDDDDDDDNDDNHSVNTKSNSPVKALIYVNKCRPFYVAPRDADHNVTCVAVKKKSRLIPIQNKNVIKTYIVTDHLECIATTNRSAIVRKVETTTHKPTTKDKSNKNKSNRSCPWPFQKISQTRCICKKRNEGSPRYLNYLMCRNIQKGIWKLQDRQAQCVRRRRCLKPICDERKFKIRTGQCYRPPKRKPNVNRRNKTGKPKT